MNDEINYKNNPLHGVSLKNLLIEIVDHYGFEILYAYLNINCFKTNPSIESSVKFLKKTDWAREKVESFYLYKFKNLPKASNEQFALSPRDRIVPDDQMPGEPAELSLEDAERARIAREKSAAAREKDRRGRPGANRKPGAQRGDFYSGNNARKPSHQDRSEAWNSSKPSGKPTEKDSDPWGKWKK